jgi:pimeloyl-ACP methyl ester carboxylesterase
MWLHASSWEAWVDHFTAAGYDPVAPGWPFEPATVELARREPDAVAGVGIDAITEHYAGIIRSMRELPVLIGHSFGGLIVQKLLGMGLGRAAVAINPAQIKGVKSLSFSQVRSTIPALGNPANRRRAVSLTPAQFFYSFANTLTSAESDALFKRYTIPSPARPLFEAALANFSRRSPAAVQTGNPDRGPLLLTSSLRDHSVPDAVARAAYRRYRASPAVTELKQFGERGHTLIADSGWREVADYALAWLTRQGVAPAAPTERR